MQTTLLTLIFALFGRIAFAIPPACLLHAVNTADEPGDLSAVCGDSATGIQSYMASNCGNFQEDAQKAFIATCSSAGTIVAEYTATANSTATSTRSSATGSGMVTSTGTARSSGSASGTGGAVQSTAGANIYYRDGMGAMGAAAIALVGAVAAL